MSETHADATDRNREVRFLHRGEIVRLADPDPQTTVLEWLRANRLTGTKEGCAEGDCGACTVALGERIVGPDGTARLQYRAVNACILFWPTLDGKHLVTVEDLAAGDGTLHPVQQAFVDAHASQCGFCTPGFVMSLWTRYRTDRSPDEEAIKDAIAGNLCRCTGYRPIVAAAKAVGDYPEPADDSAAVLTALAGLARTGTLDLAMGGRRFLAPRTVDEAAATLAAHPDATILAGGTDVGLWVTKFHRQLDPIVYLGDIPDLKTVAETADGADLDVGAGATYSDLLPHLDRHWPDFARMVRVLGAVQVRNSGTMGGNVANGSPIGDSMPALIALGTRIVLNRGGVRRTLPLEDFYIDYKVKDLQPAEFVERLLIPLPTAGRVFRTYKVSKRREQDISAVAAGFEVQLGEGNRVAGIRIAYGGMAAIPKRALNLEEALIDRLWDEATVEAALPALDRDFAPISDMRASAGYRRTVAANLLRRFLLETSGGATEPLRVTDYA